MVSVANKIDAAESLENYPSDVLHISAKDRQGIEDLKEALVNLSNLQRLDGKEAMVTNVRHFEQLQKAGAALKEVMDGMESGIPGDLLAIDIRKSLHHLGEITGEIDVDRDILGTIFGKFCIGK